MDTITDRMPPHWVTESLERSEARIDAGQTVPLDPVPDRLRSSIAHMKPGKSPADPKIARGD
jgi:hypothetical protein